jgi:predicted P-loop ATPase
MAEAYAQITAGASWWEWPESSAQVEQAERRAVDPWEQPIASYLLGKSETTVHEVLTHALSVPLDRMSGSDDKRVAAALRGIGWVAPRTSTRRNGVPMRVWRRA